MTAVIKTIPDLSNIQVGFYDCGHKFRSVAVPKGIGKTTIAHALCLGAGICGHISMLLHTNTKTSSYIALEKMPDEIKELNAGMTVKMISI